MKILLSLLLTGIAPLSADDWSLRESPSEWETLGFSESLDLSGIDVLDGRYCLMGTDELFSAQPGMIDRENRRIFARTPVPLLTPPADVKKPEADIEGIAAAPDRGSFFITGSHGAGKKKGDLQPTRMHVFEAPMNNDDGKIRERDIRSGSLLPWFEESPLFHDFVGKPLQQNGLNIEGLAYRDGRLWFGCRAPNIRGKIHVIEAEPDTLFGDATPKAKAHELHVGEGRGIRSLAATAEGFLLITGNAAAEASKQIPQTLAKSPDTLFELFFWKPGEPARRIGRLPSSPGKAEAMWIIRETTVHIDVLILHDSAPGGAPRQIRVVKPR